MPDVSTFPTHAARPGTLDRIRRLLDEAFEGAFSDEDWDHACGGWHVVVTQDGALVSHAAVVPRTIEFGGRPLRSGYVEGVATAPSVQQAGHGSLAMLEVANVIRREYDVGVLATGRHRFYEHLGWERWRGPTFARTDDEHVVHTAEDDDAVMVLRFGASSDLRLTDPIVCASRPGDDW